MKKSWKIFLITTGLLVLSGIFAYKSYKDFWDHWDIIRGRK